MNLEQLKIIIWVLCFFCVVLIFVLLNLKANIRDLEGIIDTTFKNEQRLADKLEIAHQALKDANDDIQRNNQDHRFNGRIRLINTALNASTPEQLEF